MNKLLLKFVRYNLSFALSPPYRSYFANLRFRHVVITGCRKLNARYSDGLPHIMNCEDRSRPSKAEKAKTQTAL